MLALYMVHIRIWGVVARDAKGKPVLLLGGQPNKYRHSFEERFKQLSDAVEDSVRSRSRAASQVERIPA
jgi:hypothetical protein